MVHTPLSDFYSLLQISRDASPSDIKIAYHRTLLRLHPDKQQRPRASPDIDIVQNSVTPTVTGPQRLAPEVESADMALVKEAYRTLLDVDLREAYDASLRREEHVCSHSPRPAQVVSLEEFSTVETEPGVCMVQEWWYRCRCGGMYRITEDDLENGTHLVGCESCSEVIWVGYEDAGEGGE